MGAPWNFLKSPSRGRSRKGWKYKDHSKIFLLWHQFWCHSPIRPLEAASKLMPLGWKPFSLSLFGAKTEPTSGSLSHLAPKRSQFLAKPPPTTLPQPLSLQNDIDFEVSRKNLWSVLFVGVGCLHLLGLSSPLQQHGGPKNDTTFQKNSTKLPKPVPLKKRHRIFNSA